MGQPGVWIPGSMQTCKSANLLFNKLSSRLRLRWTHAMLIYDLRSYSAIVIIRSDWRSYDGPTWSTFLIDLRCQHLDVGT
jgi:hypothetical protein